MKKNSRIMIFLLELSPFLFTLINGIRAAMAGFGLGSNNSGFQGFFESVNFSFIFIWPTYILGIGFMIKAFKGKMPKIILFILLAVFCLFLLITMFLSVVNLNNIANQMAPV